MCYDREKDPLLVLNVKLLVVSRQFTEHGIAGFGTFLGVLGSLDESFVAALEQDGFQIHSCST